MRILAFLLVAAALAGCSDGPEPTPVDPNAPPDVATGPDVGAISGVVVSASIVPIEGVQVRIIGGGETTTDGQGIFLFEDLDPGTYFLEAAAPQYMPVQQSVDVAAGAVSKARVLMEFDPTPQPYHQTLPFEGYVDASVGIVNWAYDITAGDALGVQTCQCIFDFDTDGPVDTFVIEAIWEDSIAPPDPYGASNYYVELEAPSGLETSYVESPARLVVSGGAFAANETDYQVRLYPDDFWPTSSQGYELYVTVFYLDGPPDGWSFVAGDR